MNEDYEKKFTNQKVEDWVMETAEDWRVLLTPLSLELVVLR